MRGITKWFRSSSTLFSMLFAALMAAGTVVWAVHDVGLFELDGDAVTSTSEDWDKVYGGTDNADVSVFISEASEHPDFDVSYFTGGGSKDVRDISEWQSTENNVAPDKDQILDAFAAAYINPANDHRVLYFGLDRFAVNGDAQVGFWFLKGQVSVAIDGDPNTADPFIGSHKVGDILVLSDFVQGGKIGEIKVYKWVGGNKPLELIGDGADCVDAAAGDAVCAEINNNEESSPWPFLPKAGDPDMFPVGAFFEGGVDLTALGVEEGCFNTFIAETRSSQSVTAQLKDYAMGAFPLCQADVATAVHDKDHNDITFKTDIPVLTEVHDKVFVTGSGIASPPDPTGTASFQLYSGLDCLPGNESGSAEQVTLGSGNPATAESTPFTPAAGQWSYSASYLGDENYPAASLPGEDCEPFTIIKRDADITTNIHNAAHVDITFGNAFVGETIHDKAFVTGDGIAPTPSGSVTFYRFSTGNCSGSSVTETVDLASGVAESSDFLLGASGGLSYLATYSGDQYYNAIDLGDLDASDCEPLTVNKRTPAIVTYIHEGASVGPAHNATDIKGGSVDVGTTVHDKAVVSGAGNTPTGTVTFYRYSTANCTGTGTPESGVALVGGMAESGSFTPTLGGGLSYVATYSGDGEYFPITLADIQKDLAAHCEPLTVNKVKAAIATNIHEGASVGPAHVATDIQGGSVDAGTTVHDKATVSGAQGTPTGTVTFHRYATGNCSGTPIDEAGVSLVGGMAESGSYTTTTSGALSYLATYSGDGVYFPITLAEVKADLATHCEPLTVNKIKANVATNIHAGASVGPAHVAADIQGGSVNAGDTVHDKATVSGALATPTGTVTFYRYPTGNCTGTPVSEAGVSMVGGMAESLSYTTTAAGGLSYLATYSGDNLYFPITLDDVKADLATHCEPLTVNALDATIATQIHEGDRVGPDHNATDLQGTEVNVGITVHDKAIVSGNAAVATPTGSVTFYRFATLDCSGGYISDGPWTLGANGMQESASFTPPVGQMSYLASYSGDSVYNPITLAQVQANAAQHCEPLTVIGVFEGCTPGYWKQSQHFGNWAYPLSTLYVDAFGNAEGKLPGLPGKYKDITLLGALEAGGNTDHEALLRHSAAALLNAASSEVTYPLSVAQIIALVQDAFANGTTAAAHAELAGYNETYDCPLARADLIQ